MSLPGFMAGSARLGSGRAGIALPSGGARQHRDSSGPSALGLSFPTGFDPSSRLPAFGRELSSAFVTCPPGFKCSFRMESWKHGFEWCGFVKRERILQALLVEKQNWLGPCMKLQLKSMEGERIFHSLIITADEQTMTTLCPLGFII